MSEGAWDFALDEIPEEFYEDQLEVDVSLGIVECKFNLKQTFKFVFSELLKEIPLKQAIAEEDAEKRAKVLTSDAYTRFSELIEKRIDETIGEIWGEAIYSALKTSDLIEKDHLREMVGKFIQQLRDNRLSVEKRLKYGPGGANRQSEYAWDDEKHMQFARKVSNLRSLWDYIINFFQREGYDPGCSQAVKRLSEFERLSKEARDVPEDLLRKVFRRKSESGPKNTPLAFALEHARRECRIDYEYQFDALHAAYKKGNRLLKSQSS